MAYKMKGWKGFDLSKHPVKPPTKKQGYQKPIGVGKTITGISNISLFPKVGQTNKKTN